MMSGESLPPTMCYYSKLEEWWKMPLCLVEVAKGSEADSRPMPKLFLCTGCMDGMEVNSKSSIELKKNQ
jgi:NADH-quinone oxidoreductase subunit G